MSRRRLGESLARTLVRFAAWRFTSIERRRFVKEWDAELWHASRSEDPRLSTRALLRMAIGSVYDARWRATRLDRGFGMMGMVMGFANDVRIAARGLIRTPGFTTTAVVTLGLGLGGATAIMTILDSVVLQPLAYPDADRLVQIENEVPGVGEGTVWQVSTAQYVLMEEEVPAISELGIYRGWGGNIETPSGPIRVSGARVSPSVFAMLGATAFAGRLFVESEGSPGGPAALVLSEEFWRAQFGADAAIIDRVVSLNGEPVQIVGIVTAGFRLPGSTVASSQAYVPYEIDRAGRFRNSHVNRVVGRIGADHTAESAGVVLQGTLPRLLERFPGAYGATFFDRYGFRPITTPLKDEVVGEVASSLWILLGGVGLVLLIALANVTNLFIVRIEERRTELSIRSALGAGVGTLGRYLAAEATTLVSGGVALALVVGLWGVPALTGLSPDSLPRVEEVGLTWRGVSATLVLASSSIFLLVLYPLMVHVRAAVSTNRGDATRNATAGRSRQRMRSVLVVSQVALALTLASGSGLLIASIRSLAAIEPGFEAEGAMTVDIYLEPSRHESNVAIWQAYREITQRVRALPGVEAAGVSTGLPLSGGWGCTVQAPEERAVLDRLGAAGHTTCAGQTYVSPGFFEAMRIPIMSGRAFENRDIDDPARASVVVSQAFAERFWPGEDPIGKGINPSGRTVEPYYRVIGVVGDIPKETVEGDPAMAIYYPIVPDPNTPGNWGGFATFRMSLAVRTAVGDPLSVFGAIRGVVADVDDAAPVVNATRLEDRLAESMARVTFVSVLLQIAAGVALLLAAVGMYGVISYLVGRRTREIGMRLALGARPDQITAKIVSGSTVLATVGLAVGVALALVSGRVLESLLHGVAPGDPLVLAVAGLILGVIAILASWIPARRAARVDPAEALRM